MPKIAYSNDVARIIEPLDPSDENREYLDIRQRARSGLRAQITCGIELDTGR